MEYVFSAVRRSIRNGIRCEFLLKQNNNKHSLSGRTYGTDSDRKDYNGWNFRNNKSPQKPRYSNNRQMGNQQQASEGSWRSGRLPEDPSNQASGWNRRNNVEQGHEETQWRRRNDNQYYSVAQSQQGWSKRNSQQGYDDNQRTSGKYQVHFRKTTEENVTTLSVSTSSAKTPKSDGEFRNACNNIYKKHCATSLLVNECIALNLLT